MSKLPSASQSPSPSRNSFVGTPATTCGNNVCESPWLPTGENCGNCPVDCGPCQETADAVDCVEDGKIALTYDDGPSAGVTDNLLTILRNKGVEATFFLVGVNIDNVGNRGGQLLQQQIAEGHNTVSHSYSHPDLETLDGQGVYDQVRNTDLAFRRYSCRQPNLIRPPYGSIGPDSRNVMTAMGYRAVNWNVDSNDWADAYTPSTVFNNYRAQIARLPPSSSSIISLQHDLFQFTVDIADEVIDLVIDAGFEPIKLDRCVWGPNFRQHPSWVHMHRACSASQETWPTVTASTCPVSDWSVWSPCDTPCGAGKQTRVRLTTPPGLEQSHAACGDVELIQQRACSAPSSCGSCAFSAWTNWGACSKACGGGTQIQTRRVTSGGDSCGPVVNTALCNMQSCVSRRALRGSALN